MAVRAEDQERILFLMEHIRAHLRESDDMDSLAALAQMSKSKLKYTFKEVAGMTVADFRARERMRCACALLTDSDLMVEEIGAAVGYSSISSFCRFFKEHQDESPGNYRVRNRKS